MAATGDAVAHDDDLTVVIAVMFFGGRGCIGDVVVAALPQIEYAKSAYEAAQDAEALLIATEWDEFRRLDWARVRAAMVRPLILDGRNLLSPREMKSQGFEYQCFGRPD